MESKYMELHKRNVALEWYEYGLEKHDDFFMRFMMHWIAFNWLYSEKQAGDERQKIKEFYRDNKAKFEKADAFSMPDIDVFMECPIFDSASGSRRDREYERIRRYDIEALLMSLYQVRCNLFHGSKCLHNDRDQRLVLASANILERYMKALLEVKQ